MMCELCKRQRITKFYYEDNLVWIVDCQTCSSKNKPIPMGALKRHTLEPTVAEIESLERALNRIGSQVFGNGRFVIDRSMRKIRDHVHYHARPI